MENLLKDVRYALRMIRGAPGFAAVAVASLALGIGANTAIFSVVNALLIRSLPYADPDRVVLVWGAGAIEGKRSQVSATDVADYRAQNSVFEDVTTYGNWSATLLDQGEPERISGMQVGDGYFSIMRGTPILGRVFTADEQIDGRDFVIVLGYGLWQQRFGGDPGVVGKTINLSGRPYVVVGVMGPEFRPLPTSLVDQRGEFYRPVAENYVDEDRSSRHLRAIARLRSGVTLEHAQAEMSAIAARLERDHPYTNSGTGVRLVTIGEDTVGELRPALLMLLGAVLFVLLIACANVGNLLLARSAARQKEIAIRIALGASRSRVIWQLLTESMLIALLGGSLGLLLANWGTSLVEFLGSKVIPSLTSIEIDTRVLGFTLAISLVTGVAFGLAPALHASNPDLNESLKEGGRSSGAGTSRSRLRNALVVSQVAMSLVLLVCSGLLIRSIGRLADVSPGFNPSNLLTMNASITRSKYPDAPSWLAFYHRLIEQTESLPGIRAAGLVSVLPLSKNFDGRGLAVEDRPKPRGEEISVDLYVATPGYLRAMEIPTRRGRTIDEQDTGTTQLVALINETMARELWPAEDPLGKRIKFPGSERNPQPWRTIVGVVGDVKQYGLDKRQPMQIYLPEAQYPVSFMTLVIRTNTEPAGMKGPVRDVIRDLDKDKAVFDVVTMDELLSDSKSLRTFAMMLLGVFSGVALLLAVVGLYGVVSYTVTQRTREIGVRVALGARDTNIQMMILREGSLLAAAGVMLGLAASAVLTRFMESLLFRVSATDSGTFAGVSLILILVALTASVIPARRASRVDPMVALRHE
ncbi:MAG TPA: ABC transporter permease [Blastocatellia bacterium]|nr:ABC transporter permease [Blastocatellia bacterium]